jgi:hypothetical protein
MERIDQFRQVLVPLNPIPPRFRSAIAAETGARVMTVEHIVGAAYGAQLLDGLPAKRRPVYNTTKPG